MKPVRMLAICAVIVPGLFFTRDVASKKQNRPVKDNAFAVLELFTSEGCSSCPPADALLARIQKEAADKPVYILAYHVDYWDRLGWKDLFSSPQYSKRQYQYSRQLNSQVYTPQLVINGRSEYIGSNESAVDNALEDALNSPTGVSLNINGQLQSGGIDLDYQVAGNAGNSQLLIAVVQKHAVSKVERGENKGRALSHVQIVRDLHALDLKHSSQGTRQIGLPEGFTAEGWELIGMIQNPGTGVIEAATRVSVK